MNTQRAFVRLRRPSFMESQECYNARSYFLIDRIGDLWLAGSTNQGWETAASLTCHYLLDQKFSRIMGTG
jgi:hypothetical protein